MQGKVVTSREWTNACSDWGKWPQKNFTSIIVPDRLGLYVTG